jgi:hydrophobic/amphiphilic exporter-1 (mainly G- bacteria), HAE1 family
MMKLQAKVEDVFRKSPYVAHVASIVNGGNTGRLFVELKDKAQRPPLATVMSDLRRPLGSIVGMTSNMNPVQNLSVGARASSSQYQIVIQAIDKAAMNQWSQKLVDAMTADRAYYTDVATDLQNSALQASLTIDRDKAAALGVGTDVLRSTLYAGFGAQQISTIYSAADSYQVIMELDPKVDWNPQRLQTIQVRTSSGSLVPLGAFSHVETTAGPLTINQLGQLPAVTISYNLPDGVALGSTVAELDKLKVQIGMPNSITTNYYGTAKTFQDSTASQGMLILSAILTIYIVLGILYESFIHPLTILSGLPAAAAGALLSLELFGYDLSIIAIIGLLMLIGIVKKNAIMMIDVAITLQRQGMNAREAIYKACLMRFRPIMMTTLAALMGTLPIALGTGASAELRQPLGVAVVGGLIVSQTLTLFVTPVLFLYMDHVSVFLKQSLFRKPRLVSVSPERRAAE